MEEAPIRVRKAGRGRKGGEAVLALRQMAAGQLAKKIEAGELTAAELLKVLSLPGPPEPPQQPLRGDWVLKVAEDG
ncbi:MAG: hypothetical protein AB9880_03260 [Christensenellales bacterium]